MPATTGSEHGTSPCPRPSRILCVLGMLADKDAAAAAAELSADVAAWYCAGLAGSRGQSGADLAERIRTSVAPAPVSAFATVGDALSAALADAGPDDGVLVFGSFLTAAAHHAGSQSEGQHHDQTRNDLGQALAWLEIAQKRHGRTSCLNNDPRIRWSSGHPVGSSGHERLVWRVCCSEIR